MKYSAKCTLLLALLAIVSCGGGGSSSEPSPPAAKIFASVAISAGNNQSATVGTELPAALVAVLLDSQGQPLAGHTINFQVVAGGGTLFAGSATSDAAGVVRERWTLGTTAGVQKVEVRGIDANGQAKVYAAFEAIATAGAPVSIAYADIAYAVQTLPVPIKIAVFDAYSNRVPGLAINFSPDNGSVSAASVVTDSLGEVAITWTLGRVIGLQILTISAQGLTPPAIELNVGRARAGAPTRIIKTSDDALSVVQHLALPVQVVVTDALDNPVPNIPVVFSAAVEHTPKTTTVYTDVDGIASLRSYFHSSGQQQLNATIAELGTVVFDVNVTASAHPFDGRYQCTMPTITFKDIDVIDNNASMETENFRNAVLISSQINETDGSAEIKLLAFKSLYITMTGTFTLDAQQQVTAAGTSTAQGSGVGMTPHAYENWSCTRL